MTESDAERTTTWNPGGAGNAEGEDLATPSTTWNPGGTGNATEAEARIGEDADVSTGISQGATEAERTGTTKREAVDSEDSGAYADAPASTTEGAYTSPDAGSQWRNAGAEDTGQ